MSQGAEAGPDKIAPSEVVSLANYVLEIQSLHLVFTPYIIEFYKHRECSGFIPFILASK